MICFPSLLFSISVIVKLCAVIVWAGIVLVSVSPVAVTSAILMYPVFPSSVAASMYSLLKSAVFMMMSPSSTPAASLPAVPVVFGIRVHQLLLLFGGTAACGLDSSKYVHR